MHEALAVLQSMVRRKLLITVFPNTEFEFQLNSLFLIYNRETFLY